MLGIFSLVQMRAQPSILKIREGWGRKPCLPAISCYTLSSPKLTITAYTMSSSSPSKKQGAEFSMPCSLALNLLQQPPPRLPCTDPPPPPFPLCLCTHPYVSFQACRAGLHAALSALLSSVVSPFTLTSSSHVPTRRLSSRTDLCKALPLFACRYLNAHPALQLCIM